MTCAAGVVDETDDATDDDLDWLMDSVVCVSPAVAEPAEVHPEEEVSILCT